MYLGAVLRDVSGDLRVSLDQQHHIYRHASAVLVRVRASVDSLSAKHVSKDLDIVISFGVERIHELASAISKHLRSSALCCKPPYSQPNSSSFLLSARCHIADHLRLIVAMPDSSVGHPALMSAFLAPPGLVLTP